MDNLSIADQLIAGREPAQATSAFKVRGVRVDAVQIPDVIARMEHWIVTRSAGHSIAFTGMHGIREARRDEGFKRILNATDLMVADGMPLVWFAAKQERLRGVTENCVTA